MPASTTVNQEKISSLSIHQEIDIKAAPGRIYKALTDAKQFSALSGNAPTEISREEGGPFSVFGGMIEGRKIELVPDLPIVPYEESE